MLTAKDEFLKELDEQGFAVRETGVSADFLKRVGDALLSIIELEKENVGPEHANRYGQVLCCAYYGDKHPEFFEFLENESILQHFEWILGEWYTMFFYSCACIPPSGGKLMSSNIHVDIPRPMKDDVYAFGGQFCVDDFTAENGGTWFLPGSHKINEKPDEDYFWKNAVRLEAPAGSICYFNPRLWHAAGQNNSNTWRRAITFGMSRPWVKPYMDIPRFIKHVPVEHLPYRTKQILGFYAITPSTFNEYLAPIEQRTFSQPNK